LIDDALEPAEGEKENQEDDQKADGDAQENADDDGTDEKADADEGNANETPFVEWMKKSCDYELTNFEDNAWNEDINKIVNSYFKDKNKLKMFVWMDKVGIKFSNNLPPSKKEQNPLDGEFVVYLKTRPDGQDVDVTLENINETLFTKLMNVDDNMKSLLKHMNHLLPNF
jgi:hypothetical protein